MRKPPGAQTRAPIQRTRRIRGPRALRRLPSLRQPRPLRTDDHPNVIVQKSPKNSPNTSYGFGAFGSNTTGTDNTGYGYQSLHSNTTGGRNTGFGSQTLPLNTVGSDNTGIGYAALANSNGSENTAIGNFALTLNASGSIIRPSGMRRCTRIRKESGNTADRQFCARAEHHGRQ